MDFRLTYPIELVWLKFHLGKRLIGGRRQGVLLFGIHGCDQLYRSSLVQNLLLLFSTLLLLLISSNLFVVTVLHSMSEQHDVIVEVAVVTREGHVEQEDEQIE